MFFKNRAFSKRRILQIKPVFEFFPMIPYGSELYEKMMEKRASATPSYRPPLGTEYTDGFCIGERSYPCGNWFDCFFEVKCILTGVVDVIDYKETRIPPSTKYSSSGAKAFYFRPLSGLGEYNKVRCLAYFQDAVEVLPWIESSAEKGLSFSENRGFQNNKGLSIAEA